MKHKRKSNSVCLDRAVVRVMDSHSCNRGSIPGQGNHIIRYAPNNIQIIADESSAELVLYLCEYIKCIARSTFYRNHGIP